MYYLANPDGGKKVEPRDGRYWCEAEGRFIDVAQNRYVLTARVADATKECYVNIFNEQVMCRTNLTNAGCQSVYVHVLTAVIECLSSQR